MYSLVKAEPLIERRELGLVVPTPTKPLEAMVNTLLVAVAVEVETSNIGVVPAESPESDKRAQGEVVPTPKRKLVLSQKNDGLFCVRAPLVPAKSIEPRVGANHEGVPAPPDTSERPEFALAERTSKESASLQIRPPFESVSALLVPPLAIGRMVAPTSEARSTAVPRVVVSASPTTASPVPTRSENLSPPKLKKLEMLKFVEVAWVEVEVTLESVRAVVEPLKMFPPVQVLVFARSVEEAAVIVSEAPRAIVVPLTVTDELARSVFATVSQVAMPRTLSERTN